MRFISRSPKLTVRAIPQEQLLVQTPSGAKLIPDPNNEGIICEFQQGGLAPWEKDAALQRFQLRGVAHGANPTWKLGHFDTELEQMRHGWSNDLREEIERVLMTRQGTEFFLCERPRLSPPWPAYDRLDVSGRRTIDVLAQQIAEKVVEDGHDPDFVIAYERENKNRPEVIHALENARKHVAEIVEVSA